MARERERERERKTFSTIMDLEFVNCGQEQKIYGWEYKHIDLLFFVHVNEEAEEVIQ